MSLDTSLPKPFKLLSYDEIDSTSEEAKRLAKKGAPEGIVVWSKKQTSGFGRRGRKWFSMDGNLFCSILIRPNCPVYKATQLNFVTSLSVAETITFALPEEVSVNCKWPNDVLIKGKKTSGILLESQLKSTGKIDWLVIGIGLNIKNFPKKLKFPATSLVHEGAERNISVEIILENICRHFLKFYELWKCQGFEPIREKWLRRASWLGEEIEIHLEKEILKGKFEKLDNDGALILINEGQLRRITAGDIFV